MMKNLVLTGNGVEPRIACRYAANPFSDVCWAVSAYDAVKQTGARLELMVKYDRIFM